MNRAQLPDEVFGIPQERKYPMPDRRHTISAIKLFNHVEDKYEEQLAKAVIKNMKKYGIDSSMIGDNNRLKKYIPKDMISESSHIRYISLSKKERSDIITITKSLKDPWKKEFNDIYLEKIVYKKIKYYSGIPIGFVIIRAITKDNENIGTITVAISPNHEGENLGYTLVKEAITFYDKCSFLDSIEYRVAKNNKRSISLIDRLGFTYISDKDNYMIYRLSKDMISESLITEASDTDISPIIYMQKELAKFKYGVPINGKIKKVSEIDFGKEYKTLTDKEFYRYKAGVCWDFANYQEIELSKIYGKGNIQNYYFIVDKAPNYPTHTITIIKLDEYYYYLESSWGKMMGVYRDKNLSKILNTVAYKLAQEEKDVTYVECRKYNGYNRLSKLSPNEYMNKMNNAQKINVSLKYSELEKVTSKMISENYLLEDNNKIKNIIFDLGNVLVSTNMEDLMAVDPDIPNDKINYIMSQWYKDEDDPIGLDEFKSIIPDRLKEASKFIPKLFEYNIRCVNLFDYTIPLIDKLKAAGYNVYFLSNWSKWSYELLNKYRKFDFLEKMNGGVWSWQTGCMKPNERIYRILLTKYNLNPEECVFFDDLKDNVEAANDVGIKGVLFDRINPDNMYINAALTESFKLIEEFGIMFKNKDIKSSIEESTTAGTIVGSNQSDSIYIVNYMQNNVFSGHKENRLGICKKGMKDLHTFGGKYDRFHYVSDLDEFKEEASDIKIYRYTGTPKNSFYEIIEDTVNDFDLYKLLTGRDLPDRSFIDYDSEFIQEECFLDTLDAIRECTEAGLLSLTENKYPVPILTETVQGRPYNYYRDLDGVFIQHEVTKIRSKSYRDKNSIPEAQVNAVKRGYLY